MTINYTVPFIWCFLCKISVTRSTLFIFPFIINSLFEPIATYIPKTPVTAEIIEFITYMGTWEWCLWKNRRCKYCIWGVYRCGSRFKLLMPFVSQRNRSVWKCNRIKEETNKGSCFIQDPSVMDDPPGRYFRCWRIKMGWPSRKVYL